jgi:hypothetical protein
MIIPSITLKNKTCIFSQPLYSKVLPWYSLGDISLKLKIGKPNVFQNIMSLTY